MKGNVVVVVFQEVWFKSDYNVLKHSLPYFTYFEVLNGGCSGVLLPLGCSGNRLCQIDNVKSIMSNWSCKNRSCKINHVKLIMSNWSCKIDHILLIMSNWSSQIDHVKFIMSNQSCQINHVIYMMLNSNRVVPQYLDSEYRVKL